MDMEHPDEPEDMAMIQQALEPIVTVVKQILDKMAAMDEEIDALTKLVNEEIIGGITNLYNSKKRMSGISELSEKYGEKMGPYKDFYSELTDGKDVFEDLYEDLEDFKKSGEIDDPALEARVEELANALRGKFEKIKGMGAQEAAPVAVEVEIEKKAPEENGGLAEKIRAMKSRSGENVFGK